MQWRHRHSTPSGYPFPGRGGACSGVSSLSQRESTARSGSLQDLASLGCCPNLRFFPQQKQWLTVQNRTVPSLATSRE